MRKLFMFAAAACSAAVAAPAAAQGYGYGPGYGYNYDQGGGYDRYDRGYNQGAEQAAVSACANQGSRYGSVQVRGAHPAGRHTVVVHGMVYNRGARRSFACSFHMGGWIADFDMGRSSRARYRY